MKQSTLVRLIIITTLLVGLTLFSVKKERVALSTGENAGNMLIPNLATSAAGIDRIAVGRKDKLLHIRQDDDDNWTLIEKDNHPVSIAVLNKILDALASSEIIAQKTAKPELLKQLGLTEKLATHLKIYQEGANEPAIDLLIGRFSPDQNGTYVKRAGENKSWVASGNLTPPIKAVHWLDQRLFSLQPHHLRAITIEHFQHEGKVVTLERPTLASLFSINGTPTDLTNSSEQYAITALLKGLDNVVFYDVLSEKVITHNKRIKRYTIDTFDGLRIILSMHGDVNLWTEMRAEYKENLSLYNTPTGKIADIESMHDRERALKNIGLFPPDLTKQRVNAMNKKSKGWAYQMPSGMMQMISKDIIK